MVQADEISITNESKQVKCKYVMHVQGLLKHHCLVVATFTLVTNAGCNVGMVLYNAVLTLKKPLRCSLDDLGIKTFNQNLRCHQLKSKWSECIKYPKRGRYSEADKLNRNKHFR